MSAELNAAFVRAMKTMKATGPDRVVVNFHGDAVPYFQFVMRNRPDEVEIVFVRHDGWTLGAPASLEFVAWSMWSQSWVAFFRKGDSWVEPRPIAEWRLAR